MTTMIRDCYNTPNLSPYILIYSPSVTATSNVTLDCATLSSIDEFRVCCTIDNVIGGCTADLYTLGPPMTCGIPEVLFIIILIGLNCCFWGVVGCSCVCSVVVGTVECYRRIAIAGALHGLELPLGGWFLEEYRNRKAKKWGMRRRVLTTRKTVFTHVIMPTPAPAPEQEPEPEPEAEEIDLEGGDAPEPDEIDYGLEAPYFDPNATSCDAGEANPFTIAWITA